jgi:hypothetical protein
VRCLCASGNLRFLHAFETEIYYSTPEEDRCAVPVLQYSTPEEDRCAVPVLQYQQSREVERAEMRLRQKYTYSIPKTVVVY